MSGKINLLPHREERRKRARTHFAVMGGMTAALGATVVAAVWFVYQQRISAQEDRNKFMKTEIAKLDKEIDEIKDVKDKIAALLARKQVIETLQTDRGRLLLLDELVRRARGRVHQVDQQGAAVRLSATRSRTRASRR